MENTPQEIPVFLKTAFQYAESLLNNAPEFSQDHVNKLMLDFYGILGSLEGQRLKSAGLISAELQAYCGAMAFNLGFQLEFPDPFKPPYAGRFLTIIGNETDTIKLDTWVNFMASFLSVYGIKPVSLKVISPLNGMPQKISIVERTLENQFGDMAPFSALQKDFRHGINNHLGGIMSLASLMLKESPGDEKLDLIMESSRKMDSLIKKYLK